MADSFMPARSLSRSRTARLVPPRQKDAWMAMSISLRAASGRIASLGWPAIERTRTDQPIVRVLLKDMGRPPDHAARDNHACEHVEWKAEMIERQRCEVVDVSVNAFAAHHLLFHARGDLEPCRFTGLLAEALGYALEVIGARVTSTVHAVPEARQLPPLSECLVHVRHDPVRATDLT